MNQKDVINSLLKEKGLKQSDLAKSLGLDQPRTSRLLKEKPLNADQLKKTAMLLGITVDELVKRLEIRPEESEYVQKLEHDVQLLEEIRDSLKRVNDKNDILLEMQEKKIKELESKLADKEKNRT